MEAVDLSGWRLNVDRARTAAAHAMRTQGSPEECPCLYCQNFVAVRPLAYPTAFQEILARLGVPVDRESEIWLCAEIAPGRLLYGGFFHAVGQVCEGPEVVQSNGAVRLGKVAPGFEIGFSRRRDLVPKSLQNGEIIQVDFTAEAPWLLPEPFPG